jgi:putative copper export protein
MSQLVLWLHLLAAAFWLGGLVFLALVVLALSGRRDVLRSVIGPVGRVFGYGAIVAWIVLAATGLFLSRGHWTETLVAKAGFAAVAVASAAVHVVTGRSQKRATLAVSRAMAGLTFVATLAVFWLATRLS